MGEKSILCYRRHTMYFHLVVFSRLQLYISHWYNQSCLIDAAYTRQVSVEGWPFAKCHHSWSHIKKYTCVWTRWQVYTQFFKEYHDSLPEEEDSIGYATFHYIVKMLTMRGDSKAGFSTYYIKLCQVTNVFIICLIGSEQWI